jgi:putative ABC transport system permease protein
VNVLRRISSVVGTAAVLAARRLFSQRGLTLVTLLGLAAAISLTVSVPMYTDAVFYHALRQELSDKTENFISTRSPFSFYFLYNSSLGKPLRWAGLAAADAYMSKAAAPAIGMPANLLIRYFRTDAFKLYPLGQASFSADSQPLEWVYFATLSDLKKHVSLVQGGAFPQAVTTAGAPLEVMVSQAVAEKIGVQAGESYTCVFYSGGQNGAAPASLTVRIAGIWQATDPQDEYWYNTPASYTDALFVPEESFSTALYKTVNNEVFLASWFLALDGTRFSVSEVPGLLTRIQAVEQQANSRLPQLKLQVSPVEVLKKYQKMAAQLDFMLYVISIPIMGLLLAFIGLVMSLVVGRQQNEIAVMRSRGATIWQVAGIAALEALGLGLLALLLSAPLGSLVAYLIGKTRTFLDFSVPFAVQPRITAAAVWLGLGMVGLALVAQVAPTLAAARFSIVTYKQETARQLRPPWWQRVWLDVLLLIPAAYGMYLLRQQGGLMLPAITTSAPALAGSVAAPLANNPFHNPLLLLVPALGIFSLTLLIVRLLPYLMEALGLMAARTHGVGFLLAMRHLSRTPGFYTAPLILLVLTLSLSAYTASLAKTLDRFLYDQTYYQSGADVSLVQWDERSADTSSAAAKAGGGETLPPSGIPAFYFPNIREYERIPGVQAATRLGIYSVTLQVGSDKVSGLSLFGVDRADFPQAAYWRRDFAVQPLNALMNALGSRRDGVLVTRGFIERNGLKIGDPLPATLDSYSFNIRRTLSFVIVGELDLFPTWMPADNDGLMLVGNLDYIFEEAGYRLPYQVWMKVGQHFDHTAIESQVYSRLGVGLLSFKDAARDVLSQQQLPERQGVFGVLSIGFAAGAILTVIGFLLYALFSFRRRFIELGVLRAVGLSLKQMVAFLAWELAVLIAVGLAAGTGLGVLVSRLFIPYLQVGTTSAAQVPPYVVIIAWPEILRIYALFASLFVVALGGLALLLVRIKIFEAVKLGETI